MDKEDIYFGDWLRMLVGDVPGNFYIEVVVRTIFVYCLLVAAMRMMGKRMAAQVSRNELAALVTLAAATGVPLQDPARGLLPPIIIAGIVVITGTAIAKRAYRDPKFESFSQGDVDTLIEDGVIVIRSLQKVRMSRNRLFAALRAEGIRHLGEVKRLYMEAGGAFTLLRDETPGPGLCVIPEWDTHFINEQERDETPVCNNCGNLDQDQLNGSCANCKSSEWINAIK